MNTSPSYHVLTAAAAPTDTQNRTRDKAYVIVRQQAFNSLKGVPCLIASEMDEGRNVIANVHKGREDDVMQEWRREPTKRGMS